MSNNTTIKAKLDIAAELTQYQSSLAEFQKELDKLHLAPNIKDGIKNIITDLKDGLKNLEKETASGEITPFNEKAINKSFKLVEDKYNALMKKAQSHNIQTAGLERDFKVLKKMAELEADYSSKVNKATKALQDKKDKLDELTSKKNNAAAERDSKIADRDLARDAAVAAKKAADAAKREESKKLAAQRIASQAVIDSQANYRASHNGSLSGWATSKEGVQLKKEETDAVNAYNVAVSESTRLTDAYNAAEQTKISAEAAAIQAVEEATKASDEFDKNEQKLTQDIQNQEAALKKMVKGSSAEFKQLKQELVDFGNANNIDWNELGIDPNKIKNIKDFQAALQQVQQSSSSSAQVVQGKLTQALQALGVVVQNTGSKIDTGTDALDDLKRKADELDGIKKKIVAFFGIENAVNLFKRAIRSAFETVKDLDKVMTEMAVVTDYQISDLWDQLPQYTQKANELGVTIHDAYESMTIFLQQGLQVNAAEALSTETLKMARIAGLNAADATDRMTNALRGFNMELNAANAQRVDDVYNNLAAKTAANVDEISTAMTKVASLAHNANMEFETTAAFLAQIIETTRESAETAGTALKTVVARFSEVKKMFTTGDLLGADEEGEVIDVNKVSEALRSAGISLNDYLTGAKGLDDIFIELASKWDSLDKVQQRYIATTAAGSRQQSRFIAMMSDYKRTQELVKYATDSAGFAEEQYAKTLDSVQTALARLQNAWNEFTMGFADNKIVVFAIEALTKIVEILDALTSKLPGVTGSFVKLTLAIVAFKVASIAASTAMVNLKAGIGSVSKDTGKAIGLFTGFGTNLLGLLTRIKDGFIAVGKGAVSFAKSLGIAIAKHPYLTALAGAITAVVIAWNFFKPKSLDSLKKEAQEAQKAAKEAADSVVNLREQLNTLNDQRKTIDNLKEGTIEWKDAVKTLNGEVDTLIEKYPQMAKALKVENGVITIDKNVAGEVMQEMQIDAIMKTSDSITSDYSVVARNADEYRADFDSVFSTFELSINQKEVEEALKEAYRQGSINSNTTTAAYMMDYFEKNGALNNREETGKDLEAIKDNLLALIKEYSTSIYTFLQNQTQKEDVSNITASRYTQTMGEILDLDTKQKGGLANFFAMSEAKFGNRQLNDDEAREMLEISTDLVNNGALIDVLSEDASYKSIKETENIDDIVNGIIGDKLGAFFTSEYVEKLKSNIQKEQEKQAEEYEKLFKDFGEDQKTMLEELNLSSTKNLIEGFEDSSDESTSKEFIDKIQEYFKSEGISKKDQGVFLDIISATSDFTNSLEYSNLDSVLEKAGFGADTTSEAFKKLIKDFIKLSEATKKYNKEVLQGQLEKTNTLMNSLKSKPETKTISTEEKENLVDMIPELKDLFYQSGEKEFTYTGKDNLYSYIQKSLPDMLEESSKQGQLSGQSLIYAGQMMDATTLGNYINPSDTANFEAMSNVLKNRAEQANVATVAIKQYEEALASANEEEIKNSAVALGQITSIYEEAAARGIEADSLDEIVSLKMQDGAYTQKDIDLAYAFAEANIELNTGLGEILDNFKDYDGVLWDSFDGLQKAVKGSSDYAKALNGLKGSLQKILGTDIDFTDEFFEEENLNKTLDLVKKLSVATSEEEANTIISTLDEFLRPFLDVPKSIKIDPDFDEDEFNNQFNELTTLINNYDNTTGIEVGVAINDEDFINGLNKILEDSKWSTEQIKDVFEKAGFDVSYKEIEVPEIRYKSTGKKVPIGYNGMQVEEYVPYTVYTKVKVPVLDSVTKTSGSSVNSSNLNKMSDNAKSAKGKNEHWENPYDELYNLSEKINESLRTREALERRYNQLLKDRSSNMADIREEYNHNIEALRQEADLQAQMAQGRLRQIGNIGNEVYTDSEGNRATFSQLGVTKYASYDASTGHITIDWEGLEQLEKTNNVKKGEAAEAYISQLEEWVESYEEVRDALWDIEDKMEEFAQKVIDSYLSFEERVMDAVVHDRQQQIDNYQTLSDAIKESNDKVIEAMRESIDMERQIRDNTKTEEDIADKEQRLAYLQRDTSGANQVEQMQLQKEIDDARQDYTDTLIDQAIETLSRQNEDAYEQRQEQIEMMQTQLNFAQAEGLLWGDVYTLMRDGMNEDGTVKADSALLKILANSEDVASKSAGAQAEWRTKFDEAYKEAQVGLTELEAKYQQDFNGDLKVEDSATRGYLQDIKDLANRYTTQQAHGSAQGTSGGSGSTAGSGTQAAAPVKQYSMDQLFELWRKNDKTLDNIMATMDKRLSEAKRSGWNGVGFKSSIQVGDMNIVIEDVDKDGDITDDVMDVIRKRFETNTTWQAMARNFG